MADLEVVETAIHCEESLNGLGALEGEDVPTGDIPGGQELQTLQTEIQDAHPSSTNAPMAPTATASALPPTAASATKRFSAVNINKKFLEKAAPGTNTPTQVNATATKSGTSAPLRPLNVPPTPSTSTSRLITTKLTASARGAAPSPTWSKSIVPNSSSSSSNEKRSGSAISPTFAPNSARGASHPSASGGSSKPVWRNLANGSTPAINQRVQLDFPTAAEVAIDAEITKQNKIADAKEAAESLAIEKHARTVVADTFRGVNLKPNAHHWDEMDDDDDFLDNVIDFGDGRQYTLAPTAIFPEEAMPDALSEAPVHQQDRFADDFDRSWPLSIPKPLTQSPPTLPIPAFQWSYSGVDSPQEAGRVLFNERSNRLEPYASRSGPAHAPTRRDGHDEGGSTSREARGDINMPGSKKLLQNALNISTTPSDGFSTRSTRNGLSSQLPKARSKYPWDRSVTAANRSDLQTFSPESPGFPAIGSSVLPGGTKPPNPPPLTVETSDVVEVIAVIASPSSILSPSVPQWTVPSPLKSGIDITMPASPVPSMKLNMTGEKSADESSSFTSATAQSLLMTSNPQLSHEALEQARKAAMQSSAERARQRRLQEEAEREKNKERARMKAAGLEMKAAVPLSKPEDLTTASSVSKELRDRIIVQNDEVLKVIQEAQIIATATVSQNLDIQSDATKSTSPVQLSSATRDATSSSSSPKLAMQPTPGLARSDSWRNTASPITPIILSLREKSHLKTPSSQVMKKVVQQKQPPFATASISRATPSILSPATTLTPSFDHIATIAEEELEVIDYAEFVRPVAVDAVASTLATTLAIGPIRPIASDYFRDDVLPKKFIGLVADTRALARDEVVVSSKLPAKTAPASAMLDIRQEVSRLRSTSPTAEATLSDNPYYQMSRPALKEKSPMGEGSGSTIRRTGPTKREVISSLDNAMSKIKGAIDGMHTVETDLDRPKTFSRHRKLDAQAQHDDFDGIPPETFDITRSEPPRSPKPVWDKWVVSLPKESQQIDPVNKRRLAMMKAHHSPIRWEILSFHPPVPGMTKKDLSVVDALFPRPHYSKASMAHSQPAVNLTKNSMSVRRQPRPEEVVSWRKPISPIAEPTQNDTGLNTVSRSPPPEASVNLRVEISPKRSAPHTTTFDNGNSQEKSNLPSDEKTASASSAASFPPPSQSLVSNPTFSNGSNGAAELKSQVATPHLVSHNLPGEPLAAGKENMKTQPSHQHPSPPWTPPTMSFALKDSPARPPDREHLKAVWSQPSVDKGLGHDSINSLEVIGDDLTPLPFTLQEMKSEDGGTPPPTISTNAPPSRMSLHDVTRAFQQVPSVSASPDQRHMNPSASSAGPIARPQNFAFPIPSHSGPMSYVPYPQTMMPHSQGSPLLVPRQHASPSPAHAHMNGNMVYSQPIWMPIPGPSGQPRSSMMRTLASPIPGIAYGAPLGMTAIYPQHTQHAGQPHQIGNRANPMMSPGVPHAPLHHAMYNGSPHLGPSQHYMHNSRAPGRADHSTAHGGNPATSPPPNYSTLYARTPW